MVLCAPPTVMGAAAPHPASVLGLQPYSQGLRKTLLSEDGGVQQARNRGSPSKQTPPTGTPGAPRAGLSGCPSHSAAHLLRDLGGSEARSAGRSLRWAEGGAQVLPGVEVRTRGGLRAPRGCICGPPTALGAPRHAVRMQHALIPLGGGREGLGQGGQGQVGRGKEPSPTRSQGTTMRGTRRPQGIQGGPAVSPERPPAGLWE